MYQSTRGCGDHLREYFGVSFAKSVFRPIFHFFPVSNSPTNQNRPEKTLEKCEAPEKKQHVSSPPPPPHTYYFNFRIACVQQQTSSTRETMNAEPSQLIRGMDVDIGMGLGDDLGGFEGFDTMFAEPNNTTDFFNLCALDEQEQDAATTSALSSPPSLVDSFGQQQRGHDFAQDSWNTAAVVAQQQQIQAWPSLTLSSSEPTRNPNVLLQGGGKPRVRKRHDEDEALEAAEEAFPVLKVCVVFRAHARSVFFCFFSGFVLRHVRASDYLLLTTLNATHTPLSRPRTHRPGCARPRTNRIHIEPSKRAVQTCSRRESFSRCRHGQAFIQAHVFSSKAILAAVCLLLSHFPRS